MSDDRHIASFLDRKGNIAHSLRLFNIRKTEIFYFQLFHASHLNVFTMFTLYNMVRLNTNKTPLNKGENEKIVTVKAAIFPYGNRGMNCNPISL